MNFVRIPFGNQNRRINTEITYKRDEYKNSSEKEITAPEWSFFLEKRGDGYYLTRVLSDSLNFEQLHIIHVKDILSVYIIPQPELRNYVRIIGECSGLRLKIKNNTIDYYVICNKDTNVELAMYISDYRSKYDNYENEKIKKYVGDLIYQPGGPGNLMAKNNFTALSYIGKNENDLPLDV